MSQLAKGTFEVELQPLAFEGAEPQWKLGRMSMDKQISGDVFAMTKGSRRTLAQTTMVGRGHGALLEWSATLRGVATPSVQ